MVKKGTKEIIPAINQRIRVVCYHKRFALAVFKQ